MQNKVVDIFINKIRKNDRLDDIKLEEIRYGLLGLYTMFSKLIVIIAIACLLGVFKDFVIFIFFYVILRSIGYGTHAKSNIMCWISSTLLLIGLPYLFCFLNLSYLTNLIIWAICFFSFLIFCPADTEKRPMINKKRKLKFKIIILVVDLIYLILIYKYPVVSNYIIPACLLQAFLSSPIGYILMGQKVRFSLNDIYLLNINCRKE